VKRQGPAVVEKAGLCPGPVALQVPVEERSSELLRQIVEQPGIIPVEI